MTIPPDQWASAWCSPDIPQQQDALASADLIRWIGGGEHGAFDPFRQILTPILPKFRTLLEIGAARLYYSQVLKHIDSTKEYAGCDISQSMIEYGKQKWNVPSFVADAEKLPCADESFDVTCLSGVIQHVADYGKSIKEAAQVARKYVLIHRAEITLSVPHEFIREAYGAELPTKRIGEDAMLCFCGVTGLRLEKRVKWSENEAGYSASYLFQKM